MVLNNTTYKLYMSIFCFTFAPKQTRYDFDNITGDGRCFLLDEGIVDDDGFIDYISEL